MKQPKRIVKRIVDVLMLVLLPLLMLEIQIGQEAHEWLGVGMLALWIAHHALNAGWWRSAWRGNYSPSRALGTAVNLLLALDMLALALSGIMMSGFVFTFLPVRGGIVMARRLHLLTSHWGMLLMSAHLGMHLDGILRLNQRRASKAPERILRGAAALVSLYGIYAFFALRLPDYLFLRTAFVLYDETKAVGVCLIEILGVMWLFATVFHCVNRALRAQNKRTRGKRRSDAAWKTASFAVPAAVCLAVIVGMNAGGQTAPWENAPAESPTEITADGTEAASPVVLAETTVSAASIQDGFVFVKGGSFAMGSPEDEPWRSADETRHTVTVSDFYISPYELRQSEYAQVTGENPSSFTGNDLPVENVSWLDAVRYCNARSERDGLIPAYTIDGDTIAWDREANGYRLPTEAEWEYACRAGTETPFNTETSISAEEANYYGHYPYEIEGNYFAQENLSTKPGEYRQTTVAVDSFSPNEWGLYNMHGNVGEWVWDDYGSYSTEDAADPSGPSSGTLRVYRGGGWNDFAKNLRSAYRATLPEDKGSFNLGIRLVRNAVNGMGSVLSAGAGNEAAGGGKVLIAFFSWGGNTRGIAEEIQSQTGADLFEIELVNPYSDDYNTVLDQAQHDQNTQARPEIANRVDHFAQYDTILLGYPNWWASIPMPIASFLEEYDFAGKTIIPFCSHGGGRFGQSLTAIAKLAPDASMGDALSVHYSGGADLSDEIAQWLARNGIATA